MINFTSTLIKSSFKLEAQMLLLLLLVILFHLLTKYQVSQYYMNYTINNFSILTYINITNIQFNYKWHNEIVS